MSGTKRRAWKPPSNVVRAVAGSCIHAPDHDEEAIDWFIEQIEEFKPHVVIKLGDDLEADGASRWPSEASHTLIDEYAALDKIDARIIAASPDAHHVRLMGNHCFNILDQGRVNPKLRELCDWRIPQYSRSGVQVNENSLKWKVVSTYDFCRRRGVFRLGQVTFGHGWLTGAKADLDHSILLGTPYGLFVGGHSHTPTHVEQGRRVSKVPLPYWYANAGCLRGLDPEYMRRNNAFNWGHGCVVVEADIRCGPAKSPRMSRQWTAETRIKEMYADWADRTK